MNRIRAEVKGFLEAAGRGNETAFLALWTCFVVMFLQRKLQWDESIFGLLDVLRTVVFGALTWGAAIYLLFVIADWKKLWKKTLPLLLIGAALLAAATYLGKCFTLERYNVVMGIYFVVMACGKSYRRMLKCVMFAAVGTLAVAGIGLVAGFTHEMPKPENVSPGYSFGTIYPNNWGYIAFLALLIAWYLWLTEKPAITFAVFWAVSAFMYFVVSCRTIALLTAVFPVLALVVYRMKDAPAPKGWAKGLIVALPFISYAFTLLLCWRMEWVHGMFYNTPLHTMAMRFVQSGVALKYNGFPLIGHPIYTSGNTFVTLNGVAEKLEIMDNSYVIYTIQRGILWVIGCLGWWSFAQYRACKQRDFALLLASLVLMVFAHMEKPGLDLWYNFVLLYPLAGIGDERI